MPTETTVLDIEIVLCDDCTCWHANGDTSGILDPEDEARVRKAPLIFDSCEGLVVTVNPDALSVAVAVGEQLTDFSSTRCGSCGTWLAGARHQGVVFITVPKVV